MNITIHTPPNDAVKFRKKRTLFATNVLLQPCLILFLENIAFFLYGHYCAQQDLCAYCTNIATKPLQLALAGATIAQLKRHLYWSAATKGKALLFNATMPFTINQLL